MPQICEVQMVNWGSLRPDTVPLLSDGVNVATGPNGSGKTCFLDGVKVLLGVDDLGAGRTAAGYVFDGGPDGAPADRAYLRATFANPVGPDGRHRLFAWAGGGCEDADQITVACVVTGSERWYAVLPGRVTWGLGEAGLAEDLAAIDALPRSRRRGPRQYDQLLDQAGVTRALRGVLALPQGATDHLVQRPQAGMLRSLLELTGKQTTLDEFRAQREQYEAARLAYAQTLERFRSEQHHLRLLEMQADRHREWVDLNTRLRRAQAVLAPAARYRDLEAQRAELGQEVAQRRKAVEEDEAALEQLGVEVPQLQAEVEKLAAETSRLEAERAEWDRRRRELDERLGSARASLERLESERAGAEPLAAGMDPESASRAVVEARRAVVDAARAADDAGAGVRRLEEEVALLLEGRALPPPQLERLRKLLAEAGIEAEAVAEVVDLPDGEAEDAGRLAEAALGDVLWGVVVDADRLRAAVAVAVESGIRLPIAARGEGTPGQVLARLEHPPHLGRLLAQLDAPIGDGRPGEGEAVTPDGVRWSSALARLAAPPSPVLGRRARERRLAAAEEELRALRVASADAESDRETSENRLESARRAAEAVTRLPGIRLEESRMRDRLAVLVPEAEGAAEAYLEVDAGLRRVGRDLARLEGRLEQAGTERDALTQRLEESRRPQLNQAVQRLQRLEAELAVMILSDEQRAALDEGEVPATEVVVQRISELEAMVGDEDRFPADVRDEVILGQLEDQRDIVAQVDALVGGRQEELDRQQRLVDEARRRYDDHVQAVVRMLSAEFSRICAAAGMEGEMRMIPGEHPREYGVDVRVAHRAGEPRRSYRDPSHSGGQRAKIAILILLAAMGVGGSADLLIMDEHIAHLDSTNIDHIAQLMGSLKGRVQFLLATPTNAESLRLGWCDLQLAFLPRSPGEAYTPPLRVMTRLTADDLEARFADPQMTLS